MVGLWQPGFTSFLSIISFKSMKPNLSNEPRASCDHRSLLRQAHLGHPITDAVITVPAYFNDSQRQSGLCTGWGRWGYKINQN